MMNSRSATRDRLQRLLAVLSRFIVRPLQTGAACAFTEPGAPPGCSRGPLARYVWLFRMLVVTLRRLWRGTKNLL